MNAKVQKLTDLRERLKADEQRISGKLDRVRKEIAQLDSQIAEHSKADAPGTKPA